jgi:hypothetical protein
MRRYADLAQSTPANLAQALLERAEVKVSLQRIEAQDWIGQARTLAARQAKPVDLAEETVRAGKPAVEPKSAEAPVDPNWRQQAGFSLFFDYMLDERGEQVWQTRVWQTRAYHDETGQEAQFPGIAPVPWVEWILKQANLLTIAASAPGASEPVTPLLSEPDADLKLEILEMSVDDAAESTGGRQRKLVVTVRFALSGSKAESVVAEQSTYQVECHTINTATDSNQLVAYERGSLQPKTLDYISRQSFPIPELGTYELQSIVLLLPPAATPAVHQGPTLRVVP